jgi:hypothetical protein
MFRLSLKATFNPSEKSHPAAKPTNNVSLPAALSSFAFRSKALDRIAKVLVL